jgi:hypothetical protein
MDPLGPNAADPRHAREYTPGEIYQLLTGAGYAVERLETGPYKEEDRSISQSSQVLSILKSGGFPADLREDCIFAVARKDNMPVDRLPLWLYAP